MKVLGLLLQQYFVFGVETISTQKWWFWGCQHLSTVRKETCTDTQVKLVKQANTIWA